MYAAAEPHALSLQVLPHGAPHLNQKEPTMWIGSIKLRVRTKDAPNAGTDSLVVATVVRDDVNVRNLKLDYPSENDLERGATRDYVYANLARNNDQTPELPPGIGQSPMPYPSHGIEFSHGLKGHLKLRLQIKGDDMWIKDDVELLTRRIRQKSSGIDTIDWVEDSEWSHVGSWPADKAISTDSSEGVASWSLNLT